MRISIGVIVVVLILIVYYLYTIQKSFQVEYELNNLELKDFDFKNLDAGNSFIQTRVKFLVLYHALFSITFSDLYLELYYNNVLVAKSSNVAENFKSITLIPNVWNTVYQTFDIKVNSAVIDLVYKIKTKQSYSLNYKMSANVYGIPVSVNKIYTK